MSFVRSLEEIMKVTQLETVDFYDAEMLTVFWKTKPEIIKKLLPRPLKPANDPIAVAFIAHYPKTNFGVTYQESALSVLAQFKGELGLYCLSMPVNSDIAMAAGREFYGYPKKMANFHFKRDGQNVEGWTERQGIRFVEMKGKISGTISLEEAIKKINEFGLKDYNLTTYNFKHFPAPGGNEVFDYNPRLIREKVEFNHKSIEKVDVEITLKPSKFDPWSEVEVVELIGGFYTIGDNIMKKGSVVAEVKPTTFAPYAFLKWDPF